MSSNTQHNKTNQATRHQANPRFSIYLKENGKMSSTDHFPYDERCHRRQIPYHDGNKVLATAYPTQHAFTKAIHRTICLKYVTHLKVFSGDIKVAPHKALDDLHLAALSVRRLVRLSHCFRRLTIQTRHTPHKTTHTHAL